MKVKHMLEIKLAMDEWAKKAGQKYKERYIVCDAVRFNWEVFHASQVRGNSILFLAELYTYLTSDQIAKALIHITGIDGREVRYDSI